MDATKDGVIAHGGAISSPPDSEEAALVAAVTRLKPHWLSRVPSIQQIVRAVLDTQTTGESGRRDCWCIAAQEEIRKAAIEPEPGRDPSYVAFAVGFVVQLVCRNHATDRPCRECMEDKP